MVHLEIHRISVEINTLLFEKKCFYSTKEKCGKELDGK